MTAPYTHPRISGAMRGRGDAPAMAAEAAGAVDRRAATVAALQKKGKHPSSADTADIAAWTAIAADWRWIESGEGEQCSGDHVGLRARIDALDSAIDRWFAAKDAGKTSNLQQITALFAMRYWAEHELHGHRPAAPHPRFLASSGHTHRAENDYPTLAEMRRSA